MKSILEMIRWRYSFLDDRTGNRSVVTVRNGAAFYKSPSSLHEVNKMNA